MAIEFNGTSDGLSLTLGVAQAAHPITMAIWWNTDQLTAEGSLIGIAATAGSNYHVLNFNGDVASDPIRARTSQSGVGVAGDSVNTSASTGTWYMGAGRFAGSTNRLAIFGTTPGAGDTTFLNFANTSRFDIGVFTTWFDGALCRGALWLAALSTAETDALAKGVSPLKISPQSLAAYWPGVRDNRQLMSFAPQFTVTGTAVRDGYPRAYGL